MKERLYPVSVKNCPIVDAIVEVRFTTELPRQAVFGIIYSKVESLIRIGKVDALPISQLPNSVLEQDENLRFKPFYKLMSEGFSLQVGPDVISVSPAMPYPGWSNYQPVIEKVFNGLLDTPIVKQVSRLGIRYTNFFIGDDIFKKVNLQILYANESIPLRNTTLRTEMSRDGFENTLQIANNARRVLSATAFEAGSLIDIDTYKEYLGDPQSKDKFITDISNAHRIEKEIFWDLLSENLKAELDPTYEKI